MHLQESYCQKVFSTIFSVHIVKGNKNILESEIWVTLSFVAAFNE